MDAQTIAELNAGYTCPPNAGPEWRKARAMGVDMSLVESNLKMTPLERMLQNDSVLKFVDELRQGKPVANAERFRKSSATRQTT